MAMAQIPVAVIGAGGHAKVVVATLQSLNWPILGCYDNDRAAWGRQVLGVPVRGGPAELPADTPAVIAIGDNAVRRRLARACVGCRWVTVVHPAAYVHPSVELGPGAVVFAGAVLQPDVRIGAHVIINTGASVDHDCVLGDFVHLAPGVRLSGSVRVGQGSFFGVGSVAIPGVRIGEWATVGAGSVVVGDLPDGVKAMGVPARPMGKGEP